MPEFDRRVARLASFDKLRNQRPSAGDLRMVGERGHFDKPFRQAQRKQRKQRSETG
ncbi:MAG: hypothetical protein OXU79_02170 [Gemmatimonadota bacterium]|nr:hypothetical protein [Gemmatimonadota bacterium]